MASSTATAIPSFLSTPTGVLSAIGLNNVFVGLMVTGIIGELSVLVLVPIVNSAAVCLLNGLQYYKYNGDYPPLNTAVASCFGGVFTLVSAKL